MAASSLSNQVACCVSSVLAASGLETYETSCWIALVRITQQSRTTTYFLAHCRCGQCSPIAYCGEVTAYCGEYAALFGFELWIRSKKSRSLVDRSSTITVQHEHNSNTGCVGVAPTLTSDGSFPIVHLAGLTQNLPFHTQKAQQQHHLEPPYKLQQTLQLSAVR